MMKKRISLLLTVFLCLTLLVSCAGSGEYPITYDLNGGKDVFFQMPDEACPGDAVIIRCHVLYDADFHVFVDGTEIEKTHYDSDYWGYSFTMPDHPVTVTVTPYTKAEIYGLGS